MQAEESLRRRSRACHAKRISSGSAYALTQFGTNVQQARICADHQRHSEMMSTGESQTNRSGLTQTLDAETYHGERVKLSR